MQLEILYEDEDLAVIRKPAALATESARVTQPDVVSELTKRWASYVGLVHRLDQPVEGLLAVARTPGTARILSGQLKNGELKKSYLALAADERETEDKSIFGEDGFQLTDYLYKNPKTKRAEVTKADVAGAKRAVLKGKILKQPQEGILLCRIEIGTGRFHQIRCQMSHAGMPLLGDYKYGTESSQLLTQKEGLKNLCLCADRLSFRHPKTGDSMHFEIEPLWLRGGIGE